MFGTAGKTFHISSSLSFVSGRELAGRRLWPHAPRPSAAVSNAGAFNFYFEDKSIQVPRDLEGKMGPSKHSPNQVLELQ